MLSLRKKKLCNDDKYNPVLIVHRKKSQIYTIELMIEDEVT